MYSEAEMKQVVTELSKLPNPRIQESEFIRDFLPMFAADPKRVDGPINVNVWLNVADSPYASVDVFNGLEYLYTVPPLLNADDTMLENIGQNGSVYATLTSASLKFAVMPKLGEAHLKQWMTDRLRSAHMPVDAAHAWNIIFKRYNLPLIELPDEVAVIKPTGKGSQPLAFTHYEEL